MKINSTRNLSSARRESVPPNHQGPGRSSFPDNRDSSIVQRKLQKLADNSIAESSKTIQRYPDEDDEERLPTNPQELVYDLTHDHRPENPLVFQTNQDRANGTHSIEWVVHYDVDDADPVYYAIHAHFNNGGNVPTHLHFKECAIDNMEILFNLPVAIYARLPHPDDSDSDEGEMMDLGDI